MKLSQQRDEWSLLLMSHVCLPLLRSEAIVGAVKCLTTPGKLARRIGSAWRSKSGTKNFAKLLSIHLSLLPPSLYPLSLSYFFP